MQHCFVRRRRTPRSIAATLASLVIAGSLAGCGGKSVKYDHPVFAPPPTRTSSPLATLPTAEELSGQQTKLTGLERELGSVLTGSSVVALVNGQPVFLDDVMGGVRQMLEADVRLTADQRQVVLKRELGKRIEKYIADEVVMQAVKLEIPADRQDAIRQSLQPAFDEIVEGIRVKENKATLEELDAFLYTQGTSLAELQDNFFRMQMVEGYLSTHARSTAGLSRQELYSHYNKNLFRYTSEQQVRYAKILIRYSEAGGREAAMKLAESLKARVEGGEPFSEVAASASHDLSRENGGDMGWVKKGSLKREIEEIIFALSSGGVSEVVEYDGRCELYFCSDLHEASTVAFADVQQQLQEELLQLKKTESRQLVRDELLENAAVATLFDDEKSREAVTTPFSSPQL
ncbi:MAG: peptidylprolyl isomerase [Planctomycetaceae bacterium]